MQFQTNNSTEFGLEMINETLLEAFRLRFKDPLLTKWNPRWGHRNISVEHEGNGFFMIGVKGLAHIHTRNERKTIHVMATAGVGRQKGCCFPISVVGKYFDDEYGETEHLLEKKKFPKDW